MRARELLWEDSETFAGGKKTPLSLAKLNPDTLEPGIKQSIRITGSTEKLFKKISLDCSEYIKVVKETNLILLHGGSRGPDLFLGRSRMDRRPRNSNKEAAELFDEMLRKSGMTALRSNSIFTTTDGYLAEDFGKVYLIFPLDGKSSFTYTNKPDITLSSIEDVGLDQEKTNVYRAQVAEWIKQFVITDLYKTLPRFSQEILESLASMARITVVTHIARQLHWVYDKNPEIVIPKELLNPNLKDYITHAGFVEKYQPRNTNLAIAMKDALEVYIHGLYYALSRDKYGWLAHEYWELY